MVVVVPSEAEVLREVAVPQPEQHLYFGVMSHSAGWQHAEKMQAEDPMNRDLDLYEMLAARGEFLDLTRQIFVLAANKEEAEERVKNHFGYTCEMHLAPGGMGWVSGQGRIYHAKTVYGSVDWRELEECPNCEAGLMGEDLRHDASVGRTDCVRCGWELDWTTGRPVDQG